MITKSNIEKAIDSLNRIGYCILSNYDHFLSDFEIEELNCFKNYWQNLCIDSYLPKNGIYRYRRFSKIKVSTSTTIALLPHSTFFQSQKINKYMGGIERVFEPLEPNIINNDFLKKNVLDHIQLLNNVVGENKEWEVGIHMFRVICDEETIGFPTPGGLHQDGADFVSIQLYDRFNVKGGQSKIADCNKKVIKKLTLKHCLDGIILNDKLLFHDASPIKLKNSASSNSGYRDILNMDFKIIDKL